MVATIIQIGLGTVVSFLGLVGLGVVGLYLASRGYDRYRLMADLIPTEIAALEPGLAEVTGTVVSAGETLRSPLDNTECVAYSHARKVHSEDDSMVDWVLWRLTGVSRATRKQSVPFYVEDGSGRVFVDGTKADFALKKDGSRTTSASNIQASSRRESVLEPGDSVYVFGEVMEKLPEPKSGDGALADGFRRFSDAMPVSSADKRELADAFRDAIPDLPSPLDGEFVISDGESVRELFVSDGSEHAGQRRQLLRVAAYAASGVFLFLVAIWTVVGAF